MKKVYTLAAAIAISSVAYAQTIDTQIVRDFSSNHVSVAAVEEANISAPAKKVKKATRAEDWKSIGEGTMRSTFLPVLWPKVFDATETFPIEIEQNVGDPTQYRIKDMYKDFDYTGLDGLFHFEAGDNYVYINTFVTADGKTVWWIPGDAENNNTGLYADVKIFSDNPNPDAGFLQLAWVFNQSLEQMETQTLYEKCPSIFGTVDNGVFTVAAMPGSDAVSSSGTVPSYIMFGHWSNLPANSGYYCNKNGDFCFTLPGVSMPAPPDPFEKYTLIGECDMFNSIMDNLFEEYTAKVAKVQVYEGEKGDFHIKNAWLAGKWNTEEQAAEIDFAIDLTDPTFGFVEEQTTGYYDAEYASEVEILSQNMGRMYYVAEQYRYTKERFIAEYPNAIIKLDAATKRINIPAASVWYFLPDLPDTSEMYMQMFGAQGSPKDSYIQLPADYVVSSAVNEIASEEFDGPTRYFNLQGVEIAAPAKGEVVIVKNGSKASKVVF